MSYADFAYSSVKIRKNKNKNKKTMLWLKMDSQAIPHECIGWSVFYTFQTIGKQCTQTTFQKCLGKQCTQSTFWTLCRQTMYTINISDIVWVNNVHNLHLGHCVGKQCTQSTFGTLCRQCTQSTFQTLCRQTKRSQHFRHLCRQTMYTINISDIV